MRSEDEEENDFEEDEEDEDVSARVCWVLTAGGDARGHW